MVVLYRSPSLTVTDPAFRAAVTSTLAGAATGKVSRRRPTGPPGSPQFASADGHETYAVLTLAGAGDAAGSRARRSRPARRTRPDRARRRPDPDRGRHQQAGQRGHRQGGGHVACRCCSCCCWSSSAAWPPPACRWPSAASPSWARSPRCGCSPWPPRCPSTRSTSPRSSAWAWPSTTACSWSAGSGRSSAAAARPSRRWPGRWPRPAGPSPCPGSPWRWRWPA